MHRPRIERRRVPRRQAVGGDVVGRRVSVGTASSSAHEDFTYSVVDAEPMRRIGERRRQQRFRTRLREAILGERRGRVIVECRIRDRSPVGARLRLHAPCPLPAAFVLTDTASGTSFWATLVWQSGHDAGVRLVPLDPGRSRLH